MLRFLVLLNLLVVSFGAPQDSPFGQKAQACDNAKCLLPDCKCSSTSPPEGIEKGKLPQFVFLTFDDAVTAINYQTYTKLFYNRSNPDGCPVATTYFISHVYTDYSKVHDLYQNHQEIALHSISHQAETDYWKNISEEDLQREFGDERILIAKFANIPEDAMQGMRLPFLQQSGDNSYKVAKDIGLSYDCSWPTQNFRQPGLWPYTLDYNSMQDCPIGPCPQSPIPGLWVFPMIDWTDQQDIVCSMVDACVNIPDNTDDLLQWFIDNFNVQYNGTRAPFGFFVHAAYFNANPIHLEAYTKFVDYLQGLEDVYLVTPGRALMWLKNPVPIGSDDWPDCPAIKDTDCVVNTCTLMKGEETMYMTICGECPAVYPWLGNPLGEAK